MKNLLFIIGLLLTLKLYCFDTLVLTSKITSVQVTDNGTKISNSISIQAQQGSFVVKLKDIPSTVDKNYIEFPEIQGLYILNIELIKTDPMLNNYKNSYQNLNKEIDSAYAQLKSLENNEKKLLEEKKTLYKKKLNTKELESFQDYFHTKGNAIKKERQDIFKQLINLREKNGNAIRQVRQAVPKFNSIKNTLFISITLMDESIQSFQWSYLLPSKSQRRFKTKEKWLSSESQNLNDTIELPDYIMMRGKVIEQQHKAPMIFATIEIYQDRQLFYSTTTDYNGEYSLKLATLTPYDLVVSFEGYKRKKVKNIFINRPSVPKQIIVMKVKTTISMLEIVAYTLPLLDLAKGFIK
ncbi:MAG: carboxypeptidase-like regulatory domain-containing protein [Flavobacteriales bacterium]|nr:carboxypeptidase-like regulatory domain-containing protein [Flavobacteriales bacterium]